MRLPSFDHLFVRLFVSGEYLANQWQVFHELCCGHDAPNREKPIHFCVPAFLKSHLEVKLCLLCWNSAWVISTIDSKMSRV